MNDFEPEWYNRLKGSPVNRRTFTSDHMEEIQQKASRLRAVNIQKQRARRTRWMMAAAAAFAIIAGLTLYHSKLGSLASEYWKEITVRHVPPEPVDPPKKIENEPKEQEKLIPLKIDAASGVLKDVWPIDDVKDISVYNDQTGEKIEIPKERQYVVIQALAWTDLVKAIALNQDAGDEKVTLALQMEDGTEYAIPYSPEQNTIDLGGGLYYASDKILLLVKGLLEPGSRLAELDRVLEQARVEYSADDSPKIDDSFMYDFRRLLIDGSDYIEWQTRLAAYSDVQPYRYFDSMGEKLDTMGEYGGADNLIALNSQLVFASSQYKTVDGVGVGSLEDEVLKKLGKPNLKTKTGWGYKSGDYVRFYLYFEEGVVKYMSINMPS